MGGGGGVAGEGISLNNSSHKKSALPFRGGSASLHVPAVGKLDRHWCAGSVRKNMCTLWR